MCRLEALTGLPTRRAGPTAAAGAARPEATEGGGAVRLAAVPAAVAAGVAAAPEAAGTLGGVGRAHGKSGTESACHTASVEQHPCTGDGWGGVPGLAGGAIPLASPPRFLRPVASRLGGIDRERERDVGSKAAPGDCSWLSTAARRARIAAMSSIWHCCNASVRDDVGTVLSHACAISSSRIRSCSKAV